MASWLEFRRCPGCGYDPATGEGEKGCHYVDCPYLPPELDVFCPRCFLNALTGEGNPLCEDPATCPEAETARANVEHVLRWRAAV